MKIRIIGETGEHNPDYISLFDGYEYSDSDFTDYLTDELEYLVTVKGLREGYMSFEVINGVLHTVTTYQYNAELHPSEIEELKEYTQGQWSDGIGEGFEQFSYFQTEDGEELFVSPWYFGQTLTHEIIK